MKTIKANSASLTVTTLALAMAVYLGYQVVSGLVPPVL